MFVRFYYMNHAIETELKVLLSREQFNRLASFYQPLTFVRQINTYYKNNNSDHYAFRIREKEGTLLFTLKNKTPEGVMEYGRLVSIQNLQFILEQTHCKVIITSPCRHHGSEWVKQLWQGYDMPGQYDSMTPILSETTYKDPTTGESLTLKGFGYRATTSLEIRVWLNAHATQDFTYAILDLSDNFHLKQQEHLVVIDKFKGLTRVNASKAISILNGSV